jgi:hypothetical protein
MAVKFFIKAVTGEYTDKDGASKKRYSVIGTVFESKAGLMMSLETLPLHAMKEGKILAYLNEPEDKPATKADPFADTPF